MEDLLTPVKSVALRQKQVPDSVEGKSEKRITLELREAKSPSDALSVLRSEPSHDEAVTSLKCLINSFTEKNGYFVYDASPEAAQLATCLVKTTVPTFWRLWTDHDATLQGETKENAQTPKDADLLLACLRTVTGVGAINARLKELNGLLRDGNTQSRSNGSPTEIEDLTNVLTLLLKGDRFFLQSWKAIKAGQKSSERALLLWKELVSLACTSRLSSTVAEAVDILNTSRSVLLDPSWISQGKLYARWLGRNAVDIASQSEVVHEMTSRAFSQFVSALFRFGHTDTLVDELYVVSLHREDLSLKAMRSLRDALPPSQQRTFLQSTLRYLSEKDDFPAKHPDSMSQWWEIDAPLVAARSGLLAAILNGNASMQKYLIEIVSASSDLTVVGNILVRRAMLASLSSDDESLSTILERTMEQFGDKMFMMHKPMVIQEINAQTLLLVAGYVHRSNPMMLFTLARSSTHLNAISNHIASTSIRNKFLGMVVGTAISRLIDKPENRVNFSLEELDTDEAEWYTSLPKVADQIGSVEALTTHRKLRKEGVHKDEDAESPSATSIMHKESKQKKLGGESSRSRATHQAGGFMPYAKPDSDPEDSDEDPTTIRRDKPKAPVYIRDLMSCLRSNEDRDRFHLGLSNAASLIRRKTNFGTEVSDHGEELASMLTGLNDPFDIEDFQNLRVNAMVALLLSQPLEMSQWFARSLFEGDYSLGQRASMLTTLGLGGRELAGFRNDESTQARPAFPSKKLPPNLHKLYTEEKEAHIVSIATKLEHSILQPLAAQAADKLSGPEALKVRTFSSRLAVEEKKPKPTSNELAKIVANGFFFPLTGRLAMSLQSSLATIFTHNLILPHFLRTLAILLHAAGPNTPLLPQMTNELWDLLLSLRTLASRDQAAREALLFTLLTLLEVNTSNTYRDRSRQIAEEHPRELVETLSWAEAVLATEPGQGAGSARAPGMLNIVGDIDTGAGEAERTKMLAAGVVVRCREIGEKWRCLLIGEGWQ